MHLDADIYDLKALTSMTLGGGVKTFRQKNPSGRDLRSGKGRNGEILFLRVRRFAE